MNKFVEQEVEKIIAHEKRPYPENMAYAAAWILGHYKGEGLKILKLGDKSSLSDYFILATTNNPIQATAIAQELKKVMRQQGMNLISAEGQDESEWVLLDFGDIMIHLFQPAAREIYNLDELWNDAEQLPIPQSYYFSPSPTGLANSGSAEEYF